MSNKKKTQEILYILLISFLVLGISIYVSKWIQVLLVFTFNLDTDHAGIVASLVQGVVAAIAAGLVLFELKNGDNLKRHQANVEEAQFILEYNRSFIENEKMTEMERYMECRLTGVDYGEVNSIIANRQDMINYLVYLEGLSSCILGGILDIDRIDNLFSYRFFLAMNHPEVQSIDLLPYATYYRGCFLLYDKWMTYRLTSSKYKNSKDGDIPLFKSSLSYQYGYEKYATPEITTAVKKGTVIGYFSGREAGQIDIAENGKVTVEFSEKKLSKDENLRLIEKHKLLNAMLKELLYNDQLIQNNKAIYLDDENKLKCNDIDVKDKFSALYDAKKIMYQEGIHFRQLNHKLTLTDNNLKAIAKLIYQTDNYIYQDMFGSEENAEIIIPKLLSSGKDSMLSLDNIFVCELNEEIISLILWYEGSLNWSSEELRKEMTKNNIIPSEMLSNVENEYVSGYSNSDDNMISILNFCVAGHAQRNKIGTKMLQTFLNEHQNQTCELCVLSNNFSAIALYESCGFEKDGKEEAAYPKSIPDHLRITMRNRKG